MKLTKIAFSAISIGALLLTLGIDRALAGQPAPGSHCSNMEQYGWESMLTRLDKIVGFSSATLFVWSPSYSFTTRPLSTYNNFAKWYIRPVWGSENRRGDKMLAEVAICGSPDGRNVLPQAEAARTVVVNVERY